MIKYLFLLFFPLLLPQVNSKFFFRIKTDFIIRAKSSKGEQQLTVGKLYYDKNIKQIVYEITFPEKETWIQKDTVLYKIINSKVVGKQRIPAGIEFSIYNLILNGDLSDYGLKTTKFRITKVEKSDGNVISTWEPPAEWKIFFGDILLSDINQQLNGIVFKNSAGEVIAKQFFRNYITVKGLLFPQEIVKEIYSNGQKVYELTTFSNIIINDISGENKYDFKIPSN